LRWISVCGHAIVSTPVGSVVSVAAPESSSGNFPTDGGLPQPISGSAPTLNFSRIAQRSLALRPACSLDRHAAHVSRRLRRLRHLHRRFDSYRLERPSCRMGIAPTDYRYAYYSPCHQHHRSSGPAPMPRRKTDVPAFRTNNYQSISLCSPFAVIASPSECRDALAGWFRPLQLGPRC
jgi:hypothetical protein